MEKTVKRNFYFYDLELYIYDFIKNTVAPVADFKKTVTDIFVTIKSLKHKDEEPYGPNTLVYKTQNEDVLFVIVDNIAETIDLRFVVSRKNELPYVEKEGVLEPLVDYLPSIKAGLAEVTHMVIFPEYKIVGSEYNFYGPRPSSITYYIENKVPYIKKVEMDLKVNMDTLKYLRENPELSLFKLSLKPNAKLISELMKGENLLQATDPSRNFDSIEIVMRRRISKRKPGFRIPISLDRWLKALTTNEREDIKSFVIKRKYDKDPIDLLSDRLVFTESLIPIENTRTIKKEDAYAIIKKHFYNTVKDYCAKIQE